MIYQSGLCLSVLTNKVQILELEVSIFIIIYYYYYFPLMKNELSLCRLIQYSSKYHL